MTKLNGKIIDCSPSSDLVVYLYGEMNEPEKILFEEHLSECERCTDEFAELSFARLGVYEWNRDEFANLATPRFTIPYAETQPAASWKDAFAGFFAEGRTWAAAGGAFALAAIVFGTILISPTLNGPDEVADTKAPAVQNPVKSELNEGDEPDSVRLPAGEQVQKELREPTVLKDVISDAPSKPNTAKSRRPARKAELEPVRPAVAQRSRAPRLNEFEDEDDTTLRLGDLLADIETN